MNKIISWCQRLSPTKKIVIVSFVLFLVALIIRIIKAGYFLPFGDEIDAAGTDIYNPAGLNINTFEEATERYRWHPMAPFHVAFNVFWKSGFDRSWFWQRFPVILASSLSIPLFYTALHKFLPKSRWPLVLSLIPLTSFLLVYYAHDMRSYAYFWLLVLLTLSFGFRVLTEKKTRGIDILLLAFGFALLPLVHYVSWPHFLALNGGLFFSILLFSHKKLLAILKLIALNAFIFVAYIPWADSAYYRFLRVFLIDSQGNSISDRPYRFDIKMFWNTADKLAGGWPIWGKLLIVLCLVGVGLLILKTLRLRNFKALNSFDRFTWFIFFYVAILLALLFIGKFPERVIPRHYFFLIWPFLFLVFYALIRIWETGKDRLLRFPLRLFVIGIVSFFIINNFINTLFYLLSPHRFSSNPRVAIGMLEPMLKSGQKKIVYSEIGNLERLKPYFRDPNLIDPDSFISSTPYYFYLGDNTKKLRELQALIDCCRKETFFLFTTYSYERKPLPVDLKDLKLITTLPGEKFLDYLNKIDASPYAKGMEHEYPRGYSTAIIAY